MWMGQTSLRSPPRDEQPLIGRLAERAALADALDGARLGGRSSVLVLWGPLGIGKTRLLEHAMASATEMRVLQFSAPESETEIPYSGLQRLLAPMLGDIDGLPDPQRDALASTFGLRGGPAAQPLLIGLAALGLLASAADERALLCVVDDAHWLDRESAEMLALVARRLDADGIVLFIALEPTPSPSALETLPRLDLVALDTETTRELAAMVAPSPLGDDACDQLVSESGGSPLAIVEFLDALDPEQILGAAALPEPLPLPLGGRLEQSFLAQVRRLPADTQSALLLTAAEPGCDSTLFSAAMAELGISEEWVTPAVSEGLIVVDGRVRFPHPYIRSAIYGSASAVERRRVHLALAEATHPDVDPARRAWHRAAAVLGTDDAVAADLEKAAVNAQACGGYAAMAVLLDRAAQLSADPHRRVERFFAAAEAQLTAGALSKASRLLGQLGQAVLDDRHRAELRRLEAALTLAQGGSASESPATLLRAARQLERSDAALARETYLEALGAACYAGSLALPGAVLEAAHAAKAAPRVPPSQATAADLLLDGYAALFTNGHEAAAPRLRQAIEALLRENDIRWIVFGCHAAAGLWDDKVLRVLATRWVELARASGALAALPRALEMYGGVCEVLAGRLDAADVCVDEARQILTATGAHGVVDRAAPARLAIVAWRGREAEARRLAEETMRGALTRAQGIEFTFAHYALAVLANGLGRYDDALRAARRATEAPALWVETMALPELVEAAARSGELEVARRAVDRLAASTTPSGTDWGLGMLARSQALVAEGDEAAEERFQAARAHLTRTTTVPHLARARLLYGEWLRRKRRRVEAREELRAAYDLFTAMGAEAFAERAEAELLASGEHVTPRKRKPGEALTAHETRIASLVSEGLSNPEIATRLFVSPRTVEYHLRKVFRKMGVASRVELASRIVKPEGDPSAKPVR
jgi:DNA-binding CsgD family transcriptional regulator